MIYGYVRISTKTQSMERQIKNILAAEPNTRIFQEVFTGTKVQGRKEFDKLMKVVKSGDTIIFDSVSRMSRNADEGIDLYMDLYNKGINLVFLKESYINTDVYRNAISNQLSMVGEEIADMYIETTNRVMIKLAERQIRIAFNQSEKEVKDLQQRTKESLQVLKNSGVVLGRPKGTKVKTKKAIKTKDTIRKHIGKLSDVEIMQLAGVSKRTYYKYKKEIVAEIESV